MPEPFFLSLLSIILIDLVLAGDNAVIIALAVQRLGGRERRIGIIVGAGLAVIIRIVLTGFASQLMQLPYLKLTGALLILWIGWKLLADNAGSSEEAGRQAGNLWEAIRLVTIADVTMSLDNVLALAGASNGHLPLLVFGLALSIPLVVFSSNLLTQLFDRYPWLIWLGAGILGRVAGEMLVTDPALVSSLPEGKWFQYLAEGLCILLILAAGKWLVKVEPVSVAEAAEGD